MAKKKKPTKPWRGWAVATGDTITDICLFDGQHDVIVRLNRPAGERCIYVEVREIDPAKE